MSLAACIERIREQKNSIASHNNIGEIDDNRFHDAWKKLQNDIVNIESLLLGGDMYERRVIELLSCDLAPAKAIESAEEFKRLHGIKSLFNQFSFEFYFYSNKSSFISLLTNVFTVFRI